MSKQLRKTAKGKQVSSAISASITDTKAVSSSKLSDAQRATVKQFATLSSADWLRVSPEASRGDVLGSILSSMSLKSTPDSAISLDQQLLQSETEVQRRYREKYEAKLERKAKEAGFESVEQMIAKRKQDELDVKERQRKLAEQKPSPPSGENDPTKKNLDRKSEKLPSYEKKLDQIVKLELLMKETPEMVSIIWNKYHSDKNCLSASIDSATYKKLHQRGRKYPLFILPLPRNDGYELYFIQFSGHQTYYTPLLEYKTHGALSRPSFVVTHYDDLAASKSIVLMVGELGESQSSNLTLTEAQNLVYQTQLFYITGNENQQKLVETFHEQPESFQYEELIKAVETLT
ncbi:hypothetical protein BATDEDRAFT_24227 [Batrachochytrium dendrobatidis JAM81]|uniref:ATP11 protein n=2 Tax=Batrachochytrium dendrobatidis TaxID=109871 RepID=F4P0T9_BATDJ|nr:uncharacterized protein BATDEDRAFT_24227 [Batrachochytrium dendrobatidis JAM81]EGF81341.1 hypothetical protein BATDEDRAFT_24227 [Batrachochytrium dendrobatidis JAM81]OAJ38010.1 hypothetical protein BDEG_21979 [Batrachochytrium dendrobatidis JEL423]|eukprot:XP_006677942.1 hypothetical protein BATDEDRAFT_24227 [Batrachochytrium dendrobatidis JAM81]